MMKWSEHKRALGIVLAYLILFLGCLGTVFWLTTSQSVPSWIQEYTLPIRCSLSGGVGGAIYLLRAVYLRSCVHNDWTGDWLPWYLIRPLVSILCGLVAFLFLSAGLIILDGARTDGAAEYGFYTLAVLAGLNLDRFVVRIEEVGKSVFGIEKSRASEDSDKS